MATTQDAGALTPASVDTRIEPPLQPFQYVILDGRTFEGGGQLVRVAVALSAITGRAVSIDNIRGRRTGKRGLRASHVAAVKLLGQISNSKVTGGHLGSETVDFKPRPFAQNTGRLSSLARLEGKVLRDPDHPDVSVQPEYTIRLDTPGSIFLIFQALYPYLLHVGSHAPTNSVKLTITGGTNTSRAPTYDYALQVMAPNFVRLGLPPLEINLHSRGWDSAPIELGTVTFIVHPLPRKRAEVAQLNNPEDVPLAVPSTLRPRMTATCFPRIDLKNRKCGKVTQVDLTVLASDRKLPGESKPLRTDVEKQTFKALRRKLASLDQSIFAVTESVDDERSSPVPVELHASEPTAHINRLYILIVAHTSMGFRIGHDAILGADATPYPPKRRPKSKKGQQLHSTPKLEINRDRITNLIHSCVDGFGDTLRKTVGAHIAMEASGGFRRPPWLDVHMRDQMVIFEALGNLHHESRTNDFDLDKPEILEDEKFWSLHTRTAQWVCQEILGDAL